MRIALIITLLQAWWQRVWCAMVKAFHLAVALVFFLLAAKAGHETFLTWQSYQEYPETGLWNFYLYVVVFSALLILALYSLLKARAVR